MKRKSEWWWSLFIEIYSSLMIIIRVKKIEGRRQEGAGSETQILLCKQHIRTQQFQTYINIISRYLPMNPCEISSSPLADFSSCRSPACQDSIAFEWWLINASYAGWESVVAHRPILLIKWKISSLTVVVHKVNGLCSRRSSPWQQQTRST